MTVTRIYVIAVMTAIVIAATAMTTLPPAAAQQSTIHIIKHGSNSYTISGGSSSVGSFDTTYRVAGERSAIRAAENLIISTITNDFRTSPTIGYITPDGTTTTDAATEPTLPSPFEQYITRSARGDKVQLRYDLRRYAMPLPSITSGRTVIIIALKNGEG
jgi:hypothetical protein